MLSLEAQKAITEAAREAGDFLKDKLQPLPTHPIRNPYAHVWKGLKDALGGCDYKNCEDADLDILLSVIKDIREKW